MNLLVEYIKHLHDKLHVFPLNKLNFNKPAMPFYTALSSDLPLETGKLP